ncbi:MAG: FkbM family methyltransferase [Desulfobacteraceae bacterium]|nr:FkbM family methyltransferase [Desulfobacteraceae bacterium]
MNIDRLKKLARKYPAIKTILYPANIVRQQLIKRKVNLQKEVVSNLGELLYNDPIIKIKEFNGIFAMDIRSDLFLRLVLFKSYEPTLVMHCQKYFDRNRDVIDVGANIGFFTVMFAKQLNNKTVLSIEPTKNALKRLRYNLELNHVIEDVVIFEGVASNQNGTVEIKTIKGREEYSSMGKMKHPSISKDSYTIENVKSITLDELVEQKLLDPGFLKVDAEGMEHLVFKGAQKILKEKRPIILSELTNSLLKENGSSSREVINSIQKHEYDIFDPIDPSIPPGKIDFGDILCFPKEMNIRMKANA